MKKQHHDVIIIGAGAAGLMCAIEAGKRGRNVLLLDKANKIAGKILISGGGRCNFTNLYIEPSAYLSNNPHFCKSALSRYTQWDFIGLLESHGLTWEEKTLGQLFCQQKSKAVVDMLVEECQQFNVTIRLQTEIEQIDQIDDGFELVVKNGGALQCESLVVATGGPSIPKMGSSDVGVRIAKQFGLKSFPFRAGLVPFVFSEQDKQTLFKNLSGIAFDTRVDCNTASFRESSLITHRGLSGPAILQVSSYWQKGDAIVVDVLPDQDVLSWLQVQQKQHPDKYLINVLSQVLPNRFAKRLLDVVLVDVIGQSKPMRRYSQKTLEAIAELLKAWRLTPTGTEGMRTAEVALGGVDTDELSSKTMEAKKAKELYCVGVVVDVTGRLGGYSF